MQNLIKSIFFRFLSKFWLDAWCMFCYLMLKSFKGFYEISLLDESIIG